MTNNFTLKKRLKFAAYCIAQSIIHPRTQIIYRGNPSTIMSNPMPWFASMGLIVFGVGVWCLSAHLKIAEMAEAARLMVYLPLGNMFGMTINPKKN